VEYRIFSNSWTTRRRSSSIIFQQWVNNRPSISNRAASCSLVVFLLYRAFVVINNIYVFHIKCIYFRESRHRSAWLAPRWHAGIQCLTVTNILLSATVSKLALGLRQPPLDLPACPSLEV
jgi:hypothetical protein